VHAVSPHTLTVGIQNYAIESAHHSEQTGRLHYARPHGFGNQDSEVTEQLARVCILLILMTYVADGFYRLLEIVTNSLSSEREINLPTSHCFLSTSVSATALLLRLQIPRLSLRKQQLLWYMMTVSNIWQRC